MLIQMGRRQFLRRTAGLTALTATVPGFLHKTGLAFAGDLAREVPPIPGLKDNRVLVVVQLAGGNDGPQHHRPPRRRHLSQGSTQARRRSEKSPEDR